VPKLLPRRSVPDANRVGILARMRVGTKLMLLVLLPVCGVVVFASIAAVDDWRQADRLREFRSATRLSFASAQAVEAVAGERMAVVLNRLRGRSPDRRRVVAAQREVDAALRAAAPQPSGERPPIDVAARLRIARRELGMLRRQAGNGSLGLQEMVEEYGVIARHLFSIVRDLDSGRPSRASGRAADAYVALVQAGEAAEMERASLAAALVRGTESVRVRGVVLEAAALDTFREYAAPRLVGELNELLTDPVGSSVERIRELMVREPASVPRLVSLGRWLAVSGTRMRGLRRLESDTRAELAAVASRDLDAAEARARREVAASVLVLVLVLGLGLVLRRSITRPLDEVSRGARMLSAGELASGVSYVGHDEIGDVAAAFRDLQTTAERLAEEIRAINLAVENSRLEHRADVAAFDGRWAVLMHGINHTMSAFAELQGRREQAERHADRIFEMSQDLLCIAGFDGYFKRVNPAFERVLGYSAATLLSRPTEEFVHPEDRMARVDGHTRLETGEDIQTLELRQLCRDGSTRRIEWSARAVPEQGLIYAVGRDVTDSRRAAAEQAALRRVATLVAKGVAPAELFAAVAREVRALFEADSAGVVRVDADGSIAALGSAPDGSSNTHEDVAAAVAGAGSATRTDREVGAPIVVEDRLWGVVTVSQGAESLPAGTEERLARFTDLVATAIANAESRAEVAASRVRVVAAAGEERRRVVRDLHDGAQQHLVHTILTLKLASRAHEEDEDEASALVTEALEQAERAIDELRELSRGILPTALTSGGLRVAVETLASRMPLPVETEVSVGRFPSVVEATAYFVVSEALTNVVKHADAARAGVSLHVEDDILHIAVRDDGVGGARPDGSGLIGLRDRVEALEGRLRIDSPTGRGTLVAAEIPLTPRPVIATTTRSIARSSFLTPEP
jgi:PAS domain S-box-containing protein